MLSWWVINFFVHPCVFVHLMDILSHASLVQITGRRVELILNSFSETGCQTVPMSFIGYLNILFSSFLCNFLEYWLPFSNSFEPFRMIYETISGISLLFDTDAFNFGFVFIRISSPSESHFLKFISVGLTHFQINHLAEKWFTYFLRLVCSQLRK